MANKPKTGFVRGTPVQTLTASTGQIAKGVEVDIPAGEAQAWANQKPPLFVVDDVAAPAKAAK